MYKPKLIARVTLYNTYKREWVLTAKGMRFGWLSIVMKGLVNSSSLQWENRWWAAVVDKMHSTNLQNQFQWRKEIIKPILFFLPVTVFLHMDHEHNNHFSKSWQTPRLRSRKKVEKNQQFCCSDNALLSIVPFVCIHLDEICVFYSIMNEVKEDLR